MGGGADIIAETTNYRFYLSYNCSSGWKPTDFSIVKVKPQKNAGGWHEREKEVTLLPWSMTEDECNFFYEALKELGKERSAVIRFSDIKKDKVTITEIWGRMIKAEQDARYWEKRARELEETFGSLRNIWYDIEEKKRKENEKAKDSGSKDGLES